jgi:hypothetical protein
MTRRYTVMVAIALATAGVERAAAQPAPPQTRAAMLDQQRDEKMTTSTPHQPGLIERWLDKYDHHSARSIFGEWYGFRFVGGDFPAGAGLNYGAGYNHVFGSTYTDRANRVEVSALGARSTRGYVRGSAGFALTNVGGAPIDVRARGQYYEYPQEDFFGLGQDSRVDTRTNYLLRSTDVDVSAAWRPTSMVEIGGGVGFMSPEVGSGTDRRYPSTETFFSSSSLPGFQSQPDFLRTDVSAAFDWRDNPLHPHSGGRYGATFSNYSDRDLHAYDFRRVDIDLQQYVPLPNRYRLIALRAAATLTDADADAGQQVPFYFQPTLGGGQTLRGFREFRFRDRNSLVLTAEYRWEAWWALDGAFFIDAGKVAFKREDLSLRDLDVSYGVGFRLHSNRAFVTRLDLAFSREGFIPLLRFEHVF